MSEYVVNGRVIQYVSVVVEASSEEEAYALAKEAIGQDQCMFGDAELDKDSLEIERE
jgi:hypothetical protein